MCKLCPSIGKTSIIAGVWEQWELVNGQPVSAWNTMQLSFRSRQLPQVCRIACYKTVLGLTPAACLAILTQHADLLLQVIVTMDVQRIGSFAVADNAFLTPRSIDASASASTTRLPTEEAEINAISQWAIQEHVNFIQKEKQVTAAVNPTL